MKITRSKRQNQEYINYEPREDLCQAACKLGKQLKVPVYVFLKEALIRKYGIGFLHDTGSNSASHKKRKSLKAIYENSIAVIIVPVQVFILSVITSLRTFCNEIEPDTCNHKCGIQLLVWIRL